MSYAVYEKTNRKSEDLSVKLVDIYEYQSQATLAATPSNLELRPSSERIAIDLSTGEVIA